jgi:FMN phosphatase YigB (HAD superfamily)
MAELYERKIAGTPKPKSHVDSVLGMLAKDYHIALITEGRELTVKRNLAQLGLERWFSMLIFDRKSAVTYRSLQASIGADKAIMVGDQIDCDVHEAKLAGWRAILVPSGFCPYWTTDTDCYLPPDATISDFSQLPDALRSIEQ